MSKPDLSDSEYTSRQSVFLGQLPEDSLVLMPTNPVAYRSNDTAFPFRANSYMLYLCGWSDPEAVLMAHREGVKWVTTLFVQPRDTKAEIWEGRRIGIEGTVSGWPVDQASSLEDIADSVTPHLDACTSVYCISGLNPKLDELISRADGAELADPTPILDGMRVLKSKEEIRLMQESVDIASASHIAAMRASFSGIGEWQIQSAIEAHFTTCKSRWSYPSIVGGGDNATILHYNSNDNEISDGELVLVDAGCEVSGYASDLTRTWPVSGKFNDQQREIYELVLKAELAGIDSCQAGSPWSSIHHTISRVLAQGLIDLGVLDCSLDDALGDDFNGPFRNYFMHGSGHMLGLDVHDVGGGRQGDDEPERKLEPGMVLTVEPGLYFGSWREDVEIPDRYAGIGVRIEDNVLITADGPVVLSSSCPKTIDEIEALVGNDR
jgi:Xaa-Pro aminopeptidase|tara:strand:+ start:10936 stop:12243 length:1308 start_codon:yes stop_codon:yes gene_type:complete